MPQLPPIANVLRARYVFSMGGVECNNVLHFRSPIAPTQLEMQRLAAGLVSHWKTFTKTQLGAHISLSYVEVTDLSPAPRATEIVGGAPANTGAIAADPLPNSVAIVISVQTAQRGRSYRGRIYICGLVETQVSGNYIDASLATALDTYYTQLVAYTPGGSSVAYELGVLSYYSGGAVRAVPIFTPATAVNIETRVDTQRRRLPGR